MDANAIRLVSGAVLIAVGAPVFFLAKYLLAPEESKKRLARRLSVIGIAWMAVGIVLYLFVLFDSVF